jgi:hypothetical protein
VGRAIMPAAGFQADSWGEEAALKGGCSQEWLPHKAKQISSLLSTQRN